MKLPEFVNRLLRRRQTPERQGTWGRWDVRVEFHDEDHAHCTIFEGFEEDIPDVVQQFIAQKVMKTGKEQFAKYGHRPAPPETSATTEAN